MGAWAHTNQRGALWCWMLGEGWEFYYTPSVWDKDQDHRSLPILSFFIVFFSTVVLWSLLLNDAFMLLPSEFLISFSSFQLLFILFYSFSSFPSILLFFSFNFFFLFLFLFFFGLSTEALKWSRLSWRLFRKRVSCMLEECRDCSYDMFDRRWFLHRTRWDVIV